MKEFLTGAAFFAVCALLSATAELIKRKPKAGINTYMVLSTVFQIARLLVFVGIYFLAGALDLPVIAAIIGAAIGLTLPTLIMAFAACKKESMRQTGEPTGGDADADGSGDADENADERGDDGGGK